MDYTKLISEAGFAKQVGLSVWGIRAWRKRSYGPQAKKLGKRIVYHSDDIAEFMRTLENAEGLV